MANEIKSGINTLQKILSFLEDSPDNPEFYQSLKSILTKSHREMGMIQETRNQITPEYFYKSDKNLKKTVSRSFYPLQMNKMVRMRKEADLILTVLQIYLAKREEQGQLDEFIRQQMLEATKKTTRLTQETKGSFNDITIDDLDDEKVFLMMKISQIMKLKDLEMDFYNILKNKEIKRKKREEIEKVYTKNQGDFSVEQEKIHRSMRKKIFEMERRFRRNNGKFIKKRRDSEILRDLEELDSGQPLLKAQSAKKLALDTSLATQNSGKLLEAIFKTSNREKRMTFDNVKKKTKSYLKEKDTYYTQLKYLKNLQKEKKRNMEVGEGKRPSGGGRRSQRGKGSAGEGRKRAREGEFVTSARKNFELNQSLLKSMQDFQKSVIKIQRGRKKRRAQSKGGLVKKLTAGDRKMLKRLPTIFDLSDIVRRNFESNPGNWNGKLHHYLDLGNKNAEYLKNLSFKDDSRGSEDSFEGNPRRKKSNNHKLRKPKPYKPSLHSSRKLKLISPQNRRRQMKAKINLLKKTTTSQPNKKMKKYKNRSDPFFIGASVLNRDLKEKNQRKNLIMLHKVKAVEENLEKFNSKRRRNWNLGKKNDVMEKDLHTGLKFLKTKISKKFQRKREHLYHSNDSQ